jgi:hypothetical protein
MLHRDTSPPCFIAYQFRQLMDALNVKNLRKTYDNGVQALKGVSLTVQSGFFRTAWAQRRGQKHAHWYYLKFGQSQ